MEILEEYGTELAIIFSLSVFVIGILLGRSRAPLSRIKFAVGLLVILPFLVVLGSSTPDRLIKFIVSLSVSGIFGFIGERRIRDAKASSWSALLLAIPFVGFLIALCLIAYKPDRKSVSKASLTTIVLLLTLLLALATLLILGDISQHVETSKQRAQVSAKSKTPLFTILHFQGLASTADLIKSTDTSQRMAITIKSSSCGGKFAGDGHLSNQVMAFIDDVDTQCQLTVRMLDHTLRVAESSGCRRYHGFGCSFAGDYNQTASP